MTITKTNDKTFSFLWQTISSQPFWQSI